MEEDFIEETTVVDDEIREEELDNVADFDINFPEEDVIDDVLNSNRVLRFFATSKKFYAIFSFICALLLAGQLYMQNTTYLPKERDLLEDNLYSGNSLNISGEELDKVISNIENELGISIEDDCEEYCLINAVLENPNLGETEKDVFCRVVNIIRDNPYINKESVYHSLLNVEVLYKNRPFSFSKNVEGVYIEDYESIGIFKDDPDYRILIHEIIHCIFSNDDTKNLPSYFSEGVTELLANEYFGESPFVELENYPFEVAVVKMLCEVTSPDAVLEAYSTGDMSIIAKEISCISGTEEEAMKALEMLDYTMKRYNDELEKGEETITDKNVMISGFIPLFRSVIETKYAPEDHSRVSYFYNEILLANIFEDEPYERYVDDLLEFGSDHKAYFSSELKGTLQNNGVLKGGEKKSSEKVK